MDLTILTSVLTQVKDDIFAMVLSVGPLGIAVVGIILVWVLAIRFFKDLIMDKKDFYKNYYGDYDDDIEEIESREISREYLEDLSGGSEGYDEEELY